MSTQNLTREQIANPDIYTRHSEMAEAVAGKPVIRNAGVPTEQIAAPDNAGQQAQVMEEMVIGRLLEGKNTQEIIKELVKGGLSKEEATQYVNSTEQSFKESPEGRKRLAAKYSRKMLFGVLWVAGGITATMVFEGWIFWGAIVFGFWDILSGFFGWLKYN
jgi:hypothetical protein